VLLSVAGTATDARKTSGTAGHATGTRELAAGATADARDAALPARTAAGAAVLATGTTVAVGVAAAAARVVLEDNVGGRRPRHRWSSRKNVSSGRWSSSDRRRNSAGHHYWFHECQFR
jgi:hypothetical protein